MTQSLAGNTEEKWSCELGGNVSEDKRERRKSQMLRPTFYLAAPGASVKLSCYGQQRALLIH